MRPWARDSTFRWLSMTKDQRECCACVRDKKLMDLIVHFTMFHWQKTESAFIYRFHKPLDWIGEMEIKCPFLLFKQLFPLLYIFRCNQHPLKSIWSSLNHQKWSPSDHNFEWTVVALLRLWGDKGCPPFAIHFLSSSVSFLSHCDDSYSCDRGWRWGRW